MPSDTTKIIDEILKKEGGYVNDPSDRGGRTAFGISEKAHPEAWADGSVTEAEARDIYARRYLAPFAGLESHPAFHQMVDWGVTSGPRLVVTKIQEIVGADMDGVLGPDTLQRVALLDGADLNRRLVVARIKQICRLVVRDPRQLRFLIGWINRALEFL